MESQQTKIPPDKIQAEASHEDRSIFPRNRMAEGKMPTLTGAEWDDSVWDVSIPPPPLLPYNII